MISAYSVCSAVIFYNLSLVLVFLLRRKTRFLARYSTSVLLFITVLGLVRLFTPVDLKPAIVIPSRYLLPAVQSALQFNIPVLNISVGIVLLIVWGCGTVGFILRDIIVELRSYRIRRNYITIEDKRIKKLAASFGSEYIVKVSPDVKEPYVSGFFRPTIYLPNITLTDDDLRFILRHEVQHVLSHDGLKKLLFLTIESLFWWNPIAHITMSEIDAILEFQCDAKITYGLDDKAVYEYMRTLLSVMKQIGSAGEPKGACTVHFAGDPPVIKQRFEVMLNRDKRKAKGARWLLCCAIVVGFLLSYMVIIQPRFEMPKGEIDGYFSVTSDNAYILFDGGQYYLFFYDSCIDKISESDLNKKPYNQLEIKGD
ncbi:MAG: M56 family metallopeptidase [Fusicatenibacter sp.]